MKVIIPVAGIGTRLRPHTHSIPKPLLEVAGKPVLSHVLDPTLALNPEEVIFVVGYKGKDIETFVREQYSFRSRFVYQDRLLGLGYALDLALTEAGDDPVLIVLGDTIIESDLGELVEAGDNVLGLMQVGDPKRFGIAEIRDGVVVGLEEKPENPKSNLALIGLYYFRNPNRLKWALEEIIRSGKTTKGEIQLTDALELMISEGVQFHTYEVQGWYDCGKKETLLDSNSRLLLKGDPPEPIEGSLLIPPVYIAADATVTNSIIGPNVSISSGTTVENSIIRNSIVGSQTTITNVVLDDSLVGSEVTVNGESRKLNIGDSSEIDVV